MMPDRLPHAPQPSEEPPQHIEPLGEHIIEDAAIAAHRVILGGPNETPRKITTPMEREMIRGRADDALHEQALQDRNQDLHQESRFDEKTEMPTEKVLNEDIIQALALAYREKASVVLIEIDGAGLKAVNDQHGSLAGDHLIQATARGIKARTRRQDRAYRRADGSDEFYVLVPFIKLADDKADEFFATVSKGMLSSIAEEIDKDEQLKASPVRELMGASIGIGWVNFADEDPRYDVMSHREVADELIDMASMNRLEHKEKLKAARNQARAEAGKEIPDDERLQ